MRKLLIFIVLVILSLTFVSSLDDEIYEKVPTDKIVLKHEKNETTDSSEIGVMYTVNPAVHQWIALQASKVWSTFELDQNIAKNNYDDSLDDQGYSSDEGILTGAGEEDEDSTDEDSCGGILPDKPYCFHFWDPDISQNGNYNKGWTYGGNLNYGSSYVRAQKLYNRAKYYYSQGDKTQAYYWLGRTSHLLMDATVPAHTHDDTHTEIPLFGGGDDEYELFIAGNHFNNAWGDGDNYKHFDGSNYIDKYYRYENLTSNFNWNNVKTNPSSLFKLFWYTAQKTQYYASDDVDGNNYFAYENGDFHYFPGSSTNDYLWKGSGATIINNEEDLEDIWGNGNKDNLKKVAEANIPQAIMSVAGLYRLFWIETHDLSFCTSGDCCDKSLQITIKSDGVPGWTDYNFCSSNNVFRRHYYCSGIDGNVNNNDILIQNCKPNEVCKNGNCICTTNLTNTTWTPWINISCLKNNKMNQTRSRIQYDSNSCPNSKNTTYYEYQTSQNCPYINFSFSVNVTADNAYSLFIGDNDSVSERFANVSNYISGIDIWSAESYTRDNVANGSYLYIVADGDYRGPQGLLIDLSIDSKYKILSGDLFWKVTATGRGSRRGIPPSVSELTDEIVLANAGSNPSKGWVTNTPCPLTNGEGGTNKLINNDPVTVPGIDSNSRWMWYNSGKDSNPKAPFSSYNHSEWLIFRIPISIIINCTKDSDCGNNSVIGPAFCSGSNITFNYLSFTCNNPGTASSYCINYTEKRLNKTCSHECENGVCICTPNLTNTTWSSWINISCLKNNKMNQTRSRIQYDSNNCPGSQNKTINEYNATEICDLCELNITNTSWSNWQNQTSCLLGDYYIQNRSKMEYDSNYSSCYLVTKNETDLWDNFTHWDFQNKTCDFCEPNWTCIEWENRTDDYAYCINVSDSKNCYENTKLENDTYKGDYSEFPKIAIDYCKAIPINITIGDWQNETCFINDTLVQKRIILTYDSNYNNCYAITQLPSDLWHNGENITNWEYQSFGKGCNYCSQDIQGSFNTSWSICTNETMNQNYTEYYIDYNYSLCCRITGLKDDCEIDYNKAYEDITYTKTCNGCKINSPLNNGKYDSKNLLVNLTSINQTPNKFNYIDNFDKNPIWKTICTKKKDCKTILGFSSGWHNITINGTGIPNCNDNSVFFVDSYSPKIKKTYPKINFYANSSTIFTFDYEELNPTWSNLYINNVKIKGIPLENNEKPIFSGFLEFYDGKDIFYSFDLMDIAGNTAKSRPLKVHVDTVPPIINNPESFWKQEGKYVAFNINITEKNFDSVYYMDNNDINPKWKTLCSILKKGFCNKKIIFKGYSPNMKIRILDKAGNSIEKNILLI